MARVNSLYRLLSSFCWYCQAAQTVSAGPEPHRASRDAARARAGSRDALSCTAGGGATRPGRTVTAVSLSRRARAPTAAAAPPARRQSECHIVALTEVRSAPPARVAAVPTRRGERILGILEVGAVVVGCIVVRIEGDGRRPPLLHSTRPDRQGASHRRRGR